MNNLYEITNDLVIDYRAREWCKLPYPNHPKGCPNYGKRLFCPPEAPLIEAFFDLSKQLWLVVVTFDLALHIHRMKTLHPDWSDRQARCVLYWQGSANKELKELCRHWVWSKPGTDYSLYPEAMGVNVIRTAKAIGLPIKARPMDTVFKIALMGYPI